MENRLKERKIYEKPEVRRVKLSLSEIALGSQCDLGQADRAW